MRELLSLFGAFARVGAMTFGGGYAMLPIMQRELVDKRGWVTEEDLMDYYAIGQCTPGVIAVNTATFIGRKRAGLPGAVSATLGVVFPSIVIITVIAAFLRTFAQWPVVQYAFRGIRVAVCVLIANAVIKLWKKSVVNAGTLGIYIGVLLLALLLDVSPILLVVLAAIAGIGLAHLEGRRRA